MDAEWDWDQGRAGMLSRLWIWGQDNTPLLSKDWWTWNPVLAVLQKATVPFILHSWMCFRLRDFKVNISTEDTWCTTTLWKKEVHQGQPLKIDCGMELHLIRSTVLTPMDSTAAIVERMVSTSTNKQEGGQINAPSANVHKALFYDNLIFNAISHKNSFKLYFQKKIHQYSNKILFIISNSIKCKKCNKLLDH